MSETAKDCGPMTPEQLERATDHGPTDFQIAMASMAGQGLGGLKYGQREVVRPTDPMADLHAAIKFLKWCQANQKSTKLGEEWLVSEAKKLAT